MLNVFKEWYIWKIILLYVCVCAPPIKNNILHFNSSFVVRLNSKSNWRGCFANSADLDLTFGNNKSLLIPPKCCQPTPNFRAQILFNYFHPTKKSSLGTFSSKFFFWSEDIGLKSSILVPKFDGYALRWLNHTSMLLQSQVHKMHSKVSGDKTLQKG